MHIYRISEGNKIFWILGIFLLLCPDMITKCKYKELFHHFLAKRLADPHETFYELCWQHEHTLLLSLNTSVKIRVDQGRAR